MTGRRGVMNANPMLETLYGLAAKYGLRVTEPGLGHFQIHGRLLVNYYPFGKNCTAYVDKTTEGRRHVSPEEAIQMALAPPPIVAKTKRDTRQRSYRHVRKRLLLKDPHCRWCRRPLDLETSTLDHVVPIARGGMDHPSNHALACQDCNRERGHAMPEVIEESYVQRKRESHSPQPQLSRTRPVDDPSPVLAGCTCGVDDPPDVLQECEFQSCEPGGEDAGAGPD